MNIIERVKAPTPKLFKLLRTVGLALLAVSGTILTAPISLPVVVVTVAGYAAVAGGILSAVSQITVDNQNNEIVHSVQDDNNSKFNKARDGIE